MILNDMIFVIENWKGTVETNFLLTLDDTIEMLKQVLHFLPFQQEYIAFR